MESKTMNLAKKNAVEFWEFPELSELDFIRHGFSTRYGGVSDGPYASMNLGFSTGDDPKKVVENFRIFADALEVDFDGMVLSDQDHGVRIRRVKKEDRGKGITRSKDYQGIDGLITKEPGITLITQHADCVPLFFADPVQGAVGMAHAGWRGTWRAMAKEMVGEMKKHFDTDPGDLYVGIGPSIGPCCFEVEDDVLAKMRELTDWKEAFVTDQGKGKYRINLWQLNRRILQSAGVRTDRIFVTDICTKCHPEAFFTHRVHGSQRGSLAGMIAIKE